MSGASSETVDYYSQNQSSNVEESQHDPASSSSSSSRPQSEITSRILAACDEQVVAVAIGDKSNTHAAPLTTSTSDSNGVIHVGAVAHEPSTMSVAAHAVPPGHFGHAIHPAPHLGAPIFPPTGENSKFRVGIFEKCCYPSGFCFMAWCCPCIPAAMEVARVHYGNATDPHTDGVRRATYRHSLSLFAFALCLEMFICGPMPLAHCMNISFVFQSYKDARQHSGIQPNCLEDCVYSVWCTPCAIIQLGHQIWDDPNHVPGCSTDDRAVNYRSMMHGNMLEMTVIRHT
jgi:hypothetical protein